MPGKAHEEALRHRPASYNSLLSYAVMGLCSGSSDNCTYNSLLSYARSARRS